MTQELVRDDLPYILMDREDENQIVAELKGAVLDKFVYHFSQGAQEVWGLSKAGVDEATREMAKRREVIRELECSYQIVNGECLMQVKVGRFILGTEGQEILMETKFGFKRQALHYTNGSPNLFWFEQAGVKASRNAKLSLIPEGMKQQVIDSAKSRGKVKEVSVENIAQSSPPQSKQDPYANITDKQVKRLYAIGHSKPVMVDGKQVMENGKPKWVKRPDGERWSKDQIDIYLQTLGIVGAENIKVGIYEDVCNFMMSNPPSVE